MHFKVFTNLQISPTLAYLGLSTGEGIKTEFLNTSINNTTIEATALNNINLIAGTSGVNLSPSGIVIGGPKVSIVGAQVDIFGGAIMSMVGITTVGDITALMAGNPASFTTAVANNASKQAAAGVLKAEHVAATAQSAGAVVATGQKDTVMTALQSAVIDVGNTADAVLGKHDT
jgi:hypothetical protein